MTRSSDPDPEQSSRRTRSSRNHPVMNEATPLLPKTSASYKSNNNNKESSSFVSWLVFGWFTPLLDIGNAKNRLDPDDLNTISFPVDCQTQVIHDVFQACWNEELEKQRHEPSLTRALFRAFGADFIRAGLLKLIHDGLVFVGPNVLHALIVFFKDPDAPMRRGLWLTATVTASQLVMSWTLRHYFFQCYATGLRIRSAVVVAVYRKSLQLSMAERQTRTIGEITNLTSIDAQRLQDLTAYLHALWYSPLQISLALFFLWKQLGASCLGGVLVILCMIPVTKHVTAWMAQAQSLLMTAKDARVEQNSEVLSHIKVIKLQAWEDSFAKRILALRMQELSHLFRYFVGWTLSNLLWTFTPLAVALTTFACYVLLAEKVLNVASALTALALFRIMRFPLFMLPQIINSTVEALVSVRRIQSFLLCQEHHHQSIHGFDNSHCDKTNSDNDNDDNKDPFRVGVRMEQFSGTYEPRTNPTTTTTTTTTTTSTDKTVVKGLDDDKGKRVQSSSSPVLCLENVNFECQAGELVAVVGPVGSSKSSLLHAILGEVEPVQQQQSSSDGTVSPTLWVRGTLAYYSQTPFILNATVRDNILFGHIHDNIDEERYQRCLDCCALRHDLELLPDGDFTEIGEKGITLSGGQKARVALARAVYHQADVTLIDDALSAVDAHVAKHLFEQAIVGELLRKTSHKNDNNNSDDKNDNQSRSRRSVIFVTNALQYLKHPSVDRIVVLRDGRVEEQGKYAELMGRPESAFSRVLALIREQNQNTEETGSADDDDTTAETSHVVAKRKSSIKDDAEMILNTLTAGDAADATAKTVPSKLMTEENREQGHVGLSVYMAWAKAAGGILAPIAILVAFALSESIQVLANWWLAYWSEHASSSPSAQVRFLSIYALVNVAAAVAGFICMVLVVLLSLKASRQLFSDLLAAVLHCPMSFFDTTPVGRILNRFSKDMDTVDEKLMNTLQDYLDCLFNVFSTLVVISVVTPIFTVCLIPMIVFYYVEQKNFTITYRELKRLDSVNRSPIYALLGESVDGVAVIRAFSAQGALFRRLTCMLDKQQHAYFLTCTAQSWLAVRLEFVGTLIITFAALSAVIQHAAASRSASANHNHETFAGLAGLAISYALSVTQMLNWSVRMASDMEANMVAVERLHEYTKLESEGDRQMPVDSQLVAAGWPSRGEIIFQGVKLCYRPGLPLVLKGLDLHIPAGSKVGVVGRTGAGKSTLVVALMRLVELSEGKILIDGQNIRHVGLLTLRRSIAVIPQDPVLFSGTVRSNLDPFEEFQDKVLLDTLRRVGLYSGSTSDSNSNENLAFSPPAPRFAVGSLLERVAEGGSNFSVGQRQLLVIARALLCGARIVILDEATAAVDAETDAAIQTVMKRDFGAATCLTVAHRLNTIMDSDYVLVMADGRAQEFDSPRNLLSKTNGLFRELVRAAAAE